MVTCAVSCHRDQRKKLGFPWISLAESGLINGLQRIQIKKIFSRDTLYPKRHIRSFILLFNGREASRGRTGVPEQKQR